MKMLKLLLAATSLGVVADAGAAPPRRDVPGYALGQATLARAPYSMADLTALQKSMLFGADDVAALRQSKAILADQTEAILDVWYGFVASTPELVVFFGDTRSGQPDANYLGAAVVTSEPLATSPAIAASQPKGYFVSPLVTAAGADDDGFLAVALDPDHGADLQHAGFAFPTLDFHRRRERQLVAQLARDLLAHELYAVREGFTLPSVP